MKGFTFTVDDNIRFFKEISERDYDSIFDHPYLKMYKRLHLKHGLKVQLNLFYECEGFDLSLFSDRYKKEWEGCSDWLKLSFHSRLENVRPYEFSGYDEVFSDTKAVNSEILRFASESSLAVTTTVHYCLATAEGVSALYDNGIRGLLGLYGKKNTPSSSYQSTEEEAKIILKGESVESNGITYAGIDIVINLYTPEELSSILDSLIDRKLIKLMIHEQYFYSDYRAYQPDFEEKLDLCFSLLKKKGYESLFFEDTI